MPMSSFLDQHPDFRRYFQSVQELLSTSYGDFVAAVNNWWSNRTETPLFVQTVTVLLSSSAPLLEELESLIQLKHKSSRLFVCWSQDYDRHSETATFTILANTSNSYIFPVSPDAQGVAPETPRSTEELRRILKLPDALEQLLRIDSSWIRPIMQLLQFELDDSDADGGERNKECFRYLQELAKEFCVLPPSLFVKEIVKESDVPAARGGFANIYRGQYRDQKVCLKVLRTFIEIDEKARKNLQYDFCREALIWKPLYHRNVLEFLGVNTELFSPGFCLVSPWMSNGDIISYLKSHPDHNKLSAITDIARGMDYLHSLDHPIVHGDIRGANILVKDDGTCCLADFGLALIAESQISTGTIHGSLRWLAPEAILPDAAPDTDKRPRDIYAFACTILEIISGKVPFADRPKEGTVIIDVSDERRPPRPEGVWCSDEMWALVERCWPQNPRMRPNSKAICDSLERMSPPKKSASCSSSTVFSSLYSSNFKLRLTRRVRASLPKSSLNLWARTKAITYYSYSVGQNITVWTSHVIIDGIQYGSGTGFTKITAEDAAAKHALRVISQN